MSKYELYYQTALAQYQRQFGQSTGFDARATAMLAVAATLAGIGAVILKDFSGQATFSVWTAVVTGLVAITFIGAGSSHAWSIRRASRRSASAKKRLPSGLTGPDRGGRPGAAIVRNRTGITHDRLFYYARQHHDPVCGHGRPGAAGTVAPLPGAARPAHGWPSDAVT